MNVDQKEELRTLKWAVKEKGFSRLNREENIRYVELRTQERKENFQTETTTATAQ